MLRQYYAGASLECVHLYTLQETCTDNFPSANKVALCPIYKIGTSLKHSNINNKYIKHQ